MGSVDDEFKRAQLENQGRVRSAFEAIFAKYGAIDEDDDIIDLRTGQLIVDNGRMRSLGVIELGDLLQSPGAPGSPGRRRARRQPRHGADYASSLSPELLPSDWQAQRKRRRNPPPDYDSSGSADAGEGASLEAYFMTSVEQYLGKLRQQMSGSPRPTTWGDSADPDDDDPDDPDDDTASISSSGSSRSSGRSSSSGSSDSAEFLESWHAAAQASLGETAALHPRFARASYSIPSSPHTMSSLPSYGRRAAGGAARLGSGHVSDDAEYVSESPSQASERSIENRDPATMHPQPEPSNGWHGAGRYAYPAPGYGGSDGDEFSAEERFEPYRAHQHRTDAFGARPSAQDGWYPGYAEPEPRARWPPPLAVSAPAIHKPQPVAPHTFF
ncbi:hypothetical protein H4R21_004898, partial [Coemansia helicoidea]